MTKPVQTKQEIYQRLRESSELLKKYGRSEYGNFLSNEEKQDAVIRNLEVIGEAAGKVPESIRNKA